MNTFRAPDLVELARRARRAPGTWVRLPADQFVPGLLADVRHGRVADLPPEVFEARTVRGPSLLGPRLDLEICYVAEVRA